MNDAICVLGFGRREVLIDAADLPLFQAHKWHVSVLHRTASGEYPYVRRTERSDGVQKSILLHRIIAGAPRGLVVDHLNRNTLDNRRANLRVCTQQVNRVNCKLHSNNTSGFRGVSWDRRRELWRATLKRHGKSKTIGYFPNPAAASTAYEAAACQ